MHMLAAQVTNNIWWLPAAVKIGLLVSLASILASFLYMPRGK